jgi:hypothetical protein
MHELLKYSTVHEALLYEKLHDDKVKCGLCKRRFLISPGQKVFCKTRLNVDGKLYTLVYGDLFHMVPSINVRVKSGTGPSINLTVVWLVQVVVKF